MKQVHGGGRGKNQTWSFQVRKIDILCIKTACLWHTLMLKNANYSRNQTESSMPPPLHTQLHSTHIHPPSHFLTYQSTQLKLVIYPNSNIQSISPLHFILLYSTLSLPHITLPHNPHHQSKSKPQIQYRNTLPSCIQLPPIFDLHLNQTAARKPRIRSAFVYFYTCFLLYLDCPVSVVFGFAPTFPTSHVPQYTIGPFIQQPFRKMGYSVCLADFGTELPMMHSEWGYVLYVHIYP